MIFHSYVTVYQRVTCFFPIVFPCFSYVFPWVFPPGLASYRLGSRQLKRQLKRGPKRFLHENTSKTIEIQTFLTIKPDITKNYVINIYIYVYIYISLTNMKYFFWQTTSYNIMFLNMPETIDIYFKTISKNIVITWRYLNLFCITFGGRHHHLYDLYRHKIYFFWYFWIASILHIYPIFGHFWMIKLHFTAQQLRSTKMAWLARLLSYCQISIW